MRVLQLVLRALELVGATGILALYVLMTNVATVVAWMLRIAVSLASHSKAFTGAVGC